MDWMMNNCLQIEKPAAATGLDVIGLLVTVAPILPFSPCNQAQIVSTLAPWHQVTSAAPIEGD